MIAIKLGGSVITNKSQYKNFNRCQTARLCKEIAKSNKEIIIVHGAGSFGHIISKKFSLKDGLQNPKQIFAVAKVQYDVQELSSMITKELIDVGIPSVSIPPCQCFVIDNNKLILENYEPIKSLMDIGIMPILFGDVIVDRNKGFDICSGDQIMGVIVDVFKPEKVIFVSDVDGLFTKDPKTNNDAELIEVVTESTIKDINPEFSVCDVTGGIIGKIESMLNIYGKSKECILVNGTVPGRLMSLLNGENVPCTRVRM